MMYFLMTNDVECHSIALNRIEPKIADEIYEVGLPMLLDLLSKYDVISTFYFTGKFVELKPEAVDLVKAHGHEIGCHGYDHSANRAFDLLTYNQQIEELKKAKNAIEPVAGKIQSFRAPALRINGDTVKALEEMGFTTDSSVCPQRFDGPLSFGSREKLKWLIAPRKPYFLSNKSSIQMGGSNILEIPISALLFGTTMRVSPMITGAIQKYLFYESKEMDKPIVFLFHPNECIEVGSVVSTTRRSKSVLGYVFADIVRQRLKLKNMGKKAIQLLDEILDDAKRYGFEFLNVKEYIKKCKPGSDKK